MSANSLKGQKIIVVGGTSGIGLATAQLLANIGAEPIILGRNLGSGEAFVREQVALGRKVGFYQVELGDIASIDSCFRQIFTEHGSIDGAFNCAGVTGKDSIFSGQAFHDGTTSNWDKVFAINVKAMWRCLQHELQHFSSQSAGSIVNCASVAGLRAANSKSASYTASKHAIVGLTKALAVEYASLGVRVNAICPGVIDTPMLGGMQNELQNSLQLKVRGSRLGAPEEVAQVVKFLLSSEASYINGTAMVVDAGGLTGAL